MYVTRSGKLKAEYLPAMYFDTSVLVDYWMTEGLEVDWSEDPVMKIISENELKDLIVVKELFKADEGIQKVVEIRKKLLFEKCKLSAVVSPLSLLELMEWNAEASFKQTAAEAVGAKTIQRKSKKEIGNYLKKLLELRRDEVKKQGGNKKEYSTGLEILMGNTSLNRGFAECHGLQGLLQADIVNFKLTCDKAWQEPSAYAYLQLGISDTMHILLAQHLGCYYIASFDEDFRRVRNIIEEENQMKVLTSPEDILAVL